TTQTGGPEGCCVGGNDPGFGRLSAPKTRSGRRGLGLRGSFPPTPVAFECDDQEASMKFRIPKQHKPTKERIDIKLEQSIIVKLDRSCQYMESDRDYVIGTILQVVFKKDKGFAEWIRLQEPAAGAADVRERRA